MAEVLTPQQRSAIENRGGNLLVSAAAGSGKTKVLVDRLMSYLLDPVKPENIDSFLMITYTKAAASELRGKIAAKLSKAIAQAPDNRHLRRQMQRLYLTKISTVHSFCGDILKEYAYMLDVPADFRVADENECVQLQSAALERVLNEAYEQTDSEDDFFALMDSQGLGRDDRNVPQLILSIYTKAKCHLNYEQWLDRCLEACVVNDVKDVGQTIWGKYLIEDLKSYLSLQIEALTKCTKAAFNEPDMQKAAVLLDDTVAQLEKMYQCTTWDQIYDLRDISYGTLTLKKCENTDLAEQIKAIRNACKEGLKKRLRSFCGSSSQLLVDIQSTQAATRALIDLVRRFEKEYTRLKRNRHVLDFSDLEHLTLDLLWGRSRSGITALAKEIGNRFCQIMVDEYQDSNAVQDAIFYALSAHRNNCFMVGDVKQSIYQFRLADPGIFLEKYNRYVPAENASTGEGRKVLLSSNFRSRDAVLEAVNDVFYDCMYESVGGLRYTEAEALSEGISHIDLPEPAIELHGICVKNDTYADEAAFVAGRIRQLLDEKCTVAEGDQLRPICEEDIVILLRSPGSVGRQFQYALEDAGIACSFDNGTELMEAEEVQFLHSMLQVISNPLQDIPLVAVLSSRVFGFSADELAAMRADHQKCDFYQALLQDQREKSKEFLRVLDQLRLDARMYSVSQLIDRIFIQTDADAIYQAMPDGDVRSENLRSFCTLASNCASVGQGSVEAFLEYLDIIASEGYQIPGNVAGKAVRIMSIHKSKGLEFPVVFLCGLSKSFNMEQTRQQVLCDSVLGLGLSCVDSDRRLRYPTVAKHAISTKMRAQALSEELRVLYVAMTRPKDRLIMTYASASIEKELLDLSSRMDLSDLRLMSEEVGSAGEWVLLAALRHSEAAQFHGLSRKPEHIRIMKHPWKISVAEQPETLEVTTDTTEEVCSISASQIAHMRTGLSYQYPFVAATKTPSKVTATQMKGRYKDQEAAEGAQRQHSYDFRKPSFVRQQPTGAQYGTAMHTLMQHIVFECCEDIMQIDAQIKHLVREGYITEQLAQDINPSDVYTFFQTDIGRKLRSGVRCVREFKFSVLDNAARYMPEPVDEDILLQGVVDCAIIEEDGITVIDFKTDRVDEHTLMSSVAGYRTQVAAYASALQKIYGLPIIHAYLYYFRIGKLISVDTQI